MKRPFALVAVWVYKLVKTRQKLVEGGVIKPPRAEGPHR